MCLFTRATSTGGKQKSNHPLLPSTTLRRRRRHVTLFFLSYTTASSEVPSRHIMKRSTRRSIRPVLPSFFSSLSLFLFLCLTIFFLPSLLLYFSFLLSFSLTLYLSIYLSLPIKFFISLTYRSHCSSFSRLFSNASSLLFAYRFPVLRLIAIEWQRFVVNIDVRIGTLDPALWILRFRGRAKLRVTSDR